MPIVPNKFPSVDLRPRIAFIGEAPGSEEEAMGVPFVGSSGLLLNQLLQECKIIRAGCFVGNVCQVRPPGNELAAFEWMGPEIQGGLAQLKSDLARFQPEIIVPLGGAGLHALKLNTPVKKVKKKGKWSFQFPYRISRWRGSIVDTDYGRLIPTYHPAYALRQWQWKPIIKFDIAKAKEEVEAGNPPLPVRESFIDLSFDQICTYLESLERQGKPITFDIETVGHLIICFGIGISSKTAIVIPFDNRWSEAEEAELWRRIANLMSNCALRKVAHNCLYDVGVLGFHYGIQVNNLYMDTMVATHACFPEFPKALAFAASIYTREPYYKWESKGSEAEDEDTASEEQKEWGAGVPRDQIYRYNAKDCCVTYECMEVLESELSRLGVRRGYETDRANLSLALEMTLRGVRYDQERAAKRLAEIDSEVAALSEIITATFGHPVNVKSKNDMRKLLYEELKYPPVYTKSGSGGLAYDADTLIKLARKFQDPRLQVLLKNVQLRTKSSFFKIDCHSDGRVHPAFNISGTETGRWSSSASFLGGRNLMNIPEDCRDVYVADPGYVLVGWDKAQAEARVVAYKAFVTTGNHIYRDLVEGKTKIHVWFGLRLIERGIAPLSPDEFLARETPLSQTWYYLSKVSIHGFSYDLGPMKWCDVVAKETDGTVIVPTATAKRIKDALYESIPSIPLWQAQVSSHIRATRRMETAFHRVRHFFGRGDDLLGEAYAFEPQATVADDVAGSIDRIANAMPEIELLQQNYDSLLAQVPEALGQKVLDLMRPLATQPITITDFQGRNQATFVIPVVMKVGKNWGELEELK